MRRSAIYSVILTLTSLTACGDPSSAEGASFASFGASEDGGETGPEGASGEGEGDTDPGDSDTGGGDAGIKFDLQPIADGSPQGCLEGEDELDLEFSYIYIANTDQGTLSKLDTQTMVEAGRYVTRPDGDGYPSRTSVNLDGDVAVANRHGGLTKIYARIEDCKDTNGVPGIQTSTSKDDVLPWGEDECVAWYSPFGHFDSQRPVAWTAGHFSEFTCSYVDQKVWSAGLFYSEVEVVRVDGDTGELEATIPIPAIETSIYGAYGGVVDADDGFWFMTYTSPAPLVHVRDDLSYEVFISPDTVHPYGITIDHEGRVWFGSDLGGSARFDPETEQWQVLDGVRGLGIQEHPDGYMWLGTWPDDGVQLIDVETMELGAFIPLPEAGGATKGVSVDFHGNVWVVDMVDSAFRIDPNTFQYDIYDQLDHPYTYSDMTGWALSNVSHPAG